jgi:predicted RNase H-like HicB family nuclease
MKLKYPAVFYPCEEGGFAVEVPDLPGCFSQGETLAEAILMGIDAASGWALITLEKNRPLPPPSSIGAIKPDPEGPKGAFVEPLVIDIDEYAKKHGNKAVRKNITIPAWLNTFAESQHINFSKALQETLLEKYRQINA